MAKQGGLCFAGENPFECGPCEWFLDIEKPAEELVKNLARKLDEGKITLDIV